MILGKAAPCHLPNCLDCSNRPDASERVTYRPHRFGRLNESIDEANGEEFELREVSCSEEALRVRQELDEAKFHECPTFGKHFIDVVIKAIRHKNCYGQISNHP